MKAIRRVAAAMLFAAICCRAGLVIDQSKPGELAVRNGAQVVLVYAHSPGQFKPYVRELRTIKGTNVLRDAPADHLHHHGLMYALHVNGVNFWEEAQAPGRQLGGMINILPVSVTQHGVERVSFAQQLHWVTDSNRSVEAALLVEDRTLTVLVDRRRNETAVEWTGAFTTRTAVKLHGTAYNGLGLRPAPMFDRVAVRQNSARAAYTREATWDVTATKWASVTAGARGAEATIAIFSASENTGKQEFFSMLNPFAYLSATQDVADQPLEYKPGEQFTIRYLVIACIGARSPDSLDARHNEWLTRKENR